MIVSGTVAVYTPEGNEVAHLAQDGNMFGEMAFFLVDENYVRLKFLPHEILKKLVFVNL